MNTFQCQMVMKSDSNSMVICKNKITRRLNYDLLYLLRFVEKLHIDQHMCA